MKALKMMKIAFISIIAVTLFTVSASAQDMDVTMDVVDKSDKNVNEEVINRIEMPETAQNPATDRDRQRDNDRMNNDENGKAMHHGVSEQARDDIENRYQMRESNENAMENRHQMRNGMN